MDDEAALIARRVALAAAAWFNAPSDVEAYRRLSVAVGSGTPTARRYSGSPARRARSCSTNWQMRHRPFRWAQDWLTSRPPYAARRAALSEARAARFWRLRDKPPPLVVRFSQPRR